jgi:hypothetical protein
MLLNNILAVLYSFFYAIGQIEFTAHGGVAIYIAMCTAYVLFRTFEGFVKLLARVLFNVSKKGIERQKRRQR